MNLQNLFEIQAGLDYHIEKEKGLEGQDLLDKKFLALKVELGELVNELPEEFKFWSNKKNDYEKALKEYVDCLHFILSIGNDINIKSFKSTKLIALNNNITNQFNAVFELISQWKTILLLVDKHPYHVVLNEFLLLGELLGFTEQQIEQAYLDKNKVNHERQQNGY